MVRRRAGSPSYRQLARRAHYSATALSEAAAGERLPSLAVTLAYVAACGGDRREWENRWRVLAAAAERGPHGETIGEDARGARRRVGPAAVRQEDTDRFVGRDRVVDELLSWLARCPLLAVVGASGSRVSSVLRAGLLPAVRSGRLTDAEWSTVLLTPGRRPLRELAIHVSTLRGIAPGSLYTDLVADPGSLDLALRQALVGRPATARVLLVIDRFEELFTLCGDERERDLFVEAALAAVSEPDNRAVVVLGVRADCHGRCADYPNLAEALQVFFVRA